ncbi:MAG: tetratricopeptide repeat protein [Sedimentisphaerales bacterium]|jgi:Flp pilus assembly protein TadD
MPNGIATENKRDNKKTLLICIALAAVTFVAFEGVSKNDFVNYDDDLYVTDNVLVRLGLSVESIKWAFTTWHMGNWHPLTWVSHIIDCSIFGLKPAGHHLVSVGFHIANVVLLFLILKKMTRAVWPSAFVAAVFGLHPLAVESVAWVAERKNVLSTFFAFLTIWAYFRYAQKPGLWRYLVVVVLFAAGLLSKPMLVTLPFVLLLLDFWPIGRFNGPGGRRRFWPAVAEKLPLLVMSAAICVVTYLAQAKSKAVMGIVTAPLWLRSDNALLSYVGYIGKIFCPAQMAVMYPLNLKGPALWQVAVCLVLLLAVTAAVIAQRHRHRFLFTGWFWYLGTLVPVIGLVQVGDQAMADRYMYLPGIGIYIAVAWLAGDAAVRMRLPKVVPAVAAAIVLVVLLLMTRVQVGYWKDGLSLCEHALAITKNNYIMHNNAGMFLGKAGRLDEAIEHFRQALAIRPLYAEAHNNMGLALQEKGLYAEAAAEFEKVLQSKPDNAKALNNYGITLAKQERYDEAIEKFSKAMEINSGYSNTLHNLYIAAVKGGKAEQALGIIKNWEQKTPGNAELYYRAGMLYETKGETASAIEQFEKGLEIAISRGRKDVAAQIKERLKQYSQTKQKN